MLPVRCPSNRLLRISLSLSDRQTSSVKITLQASSHESAISLRRLSPHGMRSSSVLEEKQFPDQSRSSRHKSPNLTKQIIFPDMNFIKADDGWKPVPASSSRVRHGRSNLSTTAVGGSDLVQELSFENIHTAMSVSDIVDRLERIKSYQDRSRRLLINAVKLPHQVQGGTEVPQLMDLLESLYQQESYFSKMLEYCLRSKTTKVSYKEDSSTRHARKKSNHRYEDQDIEKVEHLLQQVQNLSVKLHHPDQQAAASVDPDELSVIDEDIPHMLNSLSKLHPDSAVFSNGRYKKHSELHEMKRNIEQLQKRLDRLMDNCDLPSLEEPDEMHAKNELLSKELDFSDNSASTSGVEAAAEPSASLPWGSMENARHVFPGQNPNGIKGNTIRNPGPAVTQTQCSQTDATAVMDKETTVQLPNDLEHWVEQCHQLHGHITNTADLCRSILNSQRLLVSSQGTDSSGKSMENLEGKIDALSSRVECLSNIVLQQQGSISGLINQNLEGITRASSAGRPKELAVCPEMEIGGSVPGNLTGVCSEPVDLNTDVSLLSGYKSSMLDQVMPYNHEVASERGERQHSVFDSMRNSIYSEVAKLISANECRPYFLEELFKLLQGLTTDYQRQIALCHIQSMVQTDVFHQQDKSNKARFYTESSSSRLSLDMDSIDHQNLDDHQPRSPHKNGAYFDYEETVLSTSMMTSQSTNSSDSDELVNTVINLSKLREMQEHTDLDAFTALPDQDTKDEHGSSVSKNSSSPTARSRHQLDNTQVLDAPQPLMSWQTCHSPRLLSPDKSANMTTTPDSNKSTIKGSPSERL